jgi:hypothetical protein
MAHETTTKGRHSELIATTALLANGWTVMESVTPEVFDLGITRPGMGREFYRVQVKTARRRDDRKDELVVYTRKNSGGVYTKDEADYIIGVIDGEVYMFENRCLTEYWCRPEDLGVRWVKLETGIEYLSGSTLKNTEAEAV